MNEISLLLQISFFHVNFMIRWDAIRCAASADLKMVARDRPFDLFIINAGGWWIINGKV